MKAVPPSYDEFLVQHPCVSCRILCLLAAEVENAH